MRYGHFVERNNSTKGIVAVGWGRCTKRCVWPVVAPARISHRLPACQRGSASNCCMRCLGLSEGQIALPRLTSAGRWNDLSRWEQDSFTSGRIGRCNCGR